jgi:hypothetical protein
MNPYHIFSRRVRKTLQIGMGIPYLHTTIRCGTRKRSSGATLETYSIYFALKHVHIMVKAALKFSMRKGPLAFVIRTNSPYELGGYGAHNPDLEWPHDNKLHSLEIEYLALNACNSRFENLDLCAICTLLTSHRFSNIRSPKLDAPTCSKIASLEVTASGS